MTVNVWYSPTKFYLLNPNILLKDFLMHPKFGMIISLIFLMMFSSFMSPLSAQENLRVDVGSYNLEAIRGGSGLPSVIIVTGGGIGADSWQDMIPDIAKFTSVVVYSRRGYGDSDPGPEPQSAIELAKELHALIGAMKIKSPVVLAGHSLGGMIVRIYTLLYPDNVAGLVLIDGSHEAQYIRWRAIDPAFDKFLTQIDTTMSQSPAAIQSEWRIFRDITTSGRLPVEGQLPDIPMAVLTAMKPDTSNWIGNTPAGKTIWRELHDEWYARTSDGLRIVSQRSEHAMYRFEPHLIVEAIEWVVDRVRSGFVN
jgi:pimeloyl-ACP methyl ester carboxylesterase